MMTGIQNCSINGNLKKIFTHIHDIWLREKWR